ncbi:hypothetical protein [Chitinophaga rhizophila]|uniref:Permuted papain-like amidase YaeF/Yiix C92 family enzyme n=1 Tax=Chitinophaga rhizophila TaxID=2866212 RepID=A0ABS7G9V7_9BACT|nr:hypothetical protein [Chitinophaga rhizophila]MBW8684447.1 hypothetical protein [Chitinophaga rhizophila]
MSISLFAQKGDWYTSTAGASPICHIKISDDELVIGDAGIPSREVKLAGGGKKDDGLVHIAVKRMNANGRTYMFHMSEDDLYFCTTFKYFKEQDSLVMFCADGADDAYKTLQDAMNAARKDTGSHFSITLYRKERLDAQKRKIPISKVSEQGFSEGLTRFTGEMDKFWQYRGYGRYEPFYLWMNLINGNAFANAFSDQYNPLTLDAKNLKVAITKYGSNPAIKKQLQDAGLLSEENP